MRLHFRELRSQQERNVCTFGVAIWVSVVYFGLILLLFLLVGDKCYSTTFLGFVKFNVPFHVHGQDDLPPKNWSKRNVRVRTKERGDVNGQKKLQT